MADHCHNLIEIIGNDAALKEVNRWKELLNTFKPTDQDPHCMRAIKAVFYPELTQDDNPDYGSKWVHQDNNAIDVSDNQLSLQSAWNRPESLENRMACLLYPLDPNVILRNSFHIGDNRGGVAYTTPVDSENAYSQETFVEIDRDEFDDSDEADDQFSELLVVEEQDMLNDFFLDDMPHLAKILRNHLSHLDIDWDQFEDDDN